MLGIERYGESDDMKCVEKVRVCKKCSGLDIKELKTQMDDTDVKLKVGCFGECKGKHPELKGKSYGLLDGELFVCDKEKEFLNLPFKM